MEKIILVTKTQGKGGYQARVFGKNPAIQTFAKTEIEALKTLVERLETIDKKFIQSPFECGEVTKITEIGRVHV